jgi:hypothetical protein
MLAINIILQSRCQWKQYSKITIKGKVPVKYCLAANDNQTDDYDFQTSLLTNP